VAQSLLLGEQGLGKTRLLREAARVTADGGLLMLRGRGTTPSAQFRALAEAVLRSAGRGPGRVLLLDECPGPQ
jgi:stage III sporulation protein SpoIIIAA